MVEISKYGSGEGLGRETGRAYSTGDVTGSVCSALRYRGFLFSQYRRSEDERARDQQDD